jgi:translocation and assembly module TamB
MARLGKTFRVLGLSLLAIVAVLSLILAVLATPLGRSVVAGVIERAGAGSGITVSIDTLTGWLPFSIGADRIVLSDSQGPFAEIDGLDVAIRTSALITGRVSLDALTARRIAVLRRPQLAGGSGGTGALLPFAAPDVRVARLELGKALAGRPAALALTGSLVSRADGGLSAKVDARRIDGGSGALHLVLARADRAAPLVASASLKESAHGILLGLMGRQSGPAYALDARIDQHGDALSGDLSLKSNGDAHFAGRFGLSSAVGGKHLVLDGSGNVAALAPPDYVDLLSGPVRVALDVDWASIKGETLPRLVLTQGEITTGSVHATASGTLGGANTDLTLGLSVAKPGGGPIALPFLGASASMDSVSLNGKGTPSGGVIRLELVGRIAGLQAQGYRVPGTGVSLALESRPDDPSATGKLPFGLRLEADAIDTPNGRVTSAPGKPLLLTATGTLDTAVGAAQTHAQLSAAGGTMAFDGTIGADTAAGRTTIGVPDLAPLSPVAGRTLGGAIEATVDGSVVGTGPAFMIAGTATDLALGDPRLDRLLAGPTRFSATVGGQPGGGMTVNKLTIDGAGLTVRGNASFDAASLAVSLDGSLTDLGRLAEKSGGAATFTLHASGEIRRPNLDARVTVARGRILDQAIDNASIDVKGGPTTAGWRATLSLSGAVAGGRLAGTALATLDRNDGALALPQVDLAAGNNRLTGSIQRTPAGLLSGALKLNAPDLRTLAALGLVTASGRGQASVELRPDGTSQSAVVSFSGADITWQTTRVGAINGEVALADVFGTPKVNGDASALAITVGGRRIDKIDATATLEGGETRINASATGPDLVLTGAARLAKTGVTIDSLQGTAFGTPVRLAQPTTIMLGAGQSRIANTDLTIGGGTVRIDGALSPQLSLIVAVSQVPASIANGFTIGLGAEGSVSGRATMSGQAASPAIDWQADWTGFALAASRKAGLPPLAIHASGKSTIDASSITARLSGAGVAVSVDGRVPFHGAGLDVKAAGTVPLSLLALSSGRELRLAGNAKLDITVNGTLASPQISGAADLADATVVDGQTGFGISGASGRIVFDRHRATIQRFSGKFPQGGTIVVAGSVTIDQSNLPADLTVRINNGRYADGNVISTTLSGDLAVKGPLLGDGVVSGQITLGRTDIQLPDRFGSSANAIDVRHVNAPPGFTPPIPRQRPAADRAAGPPAGGGLKLDVSLSGNSGIYVRGFGIDAELGGSLKLAGTTGGPQAAGAFKMQRGRMDAVGKRFTFTQGTLTFSGSVIPVVDFAATTQTADATVTLSVTGPATDPQISFSSSPSLPEEEILSRLLFNRGVGTLSPAEALQLVDAVGQLTGATGSGGIVGRIRSATGLDDLDIRQGQNGGTIVGIGKRLTDSVRLGVQTGGGGTSGRVTIDLDITKNLKAQGSAGQDGSGQVGLTYERDY